MVDVGVVATPALAHLDAQGEEDLDADDCLDLLRAALPMLLITDPPLPIRMAFCDSVSTTIAASISTSGRSERSSRKCSSTAIACGTSSCVRRSACSRTSSAISSSSGWSLTVPSGK